MSFESVIGTNPKDFVIRGSLIGIITVGGAAVAKPALEEVIASISSPKKIVREVDPVLSPQRFDVKYPSEGVTSIYAVGNKRNPNLDNTLVNTARFKLIEKNGQTGVQFTDEKPRKISAATHYNGSTSLILKTEQPSDPKITSERDKPDKFPFMEVKTDVPEPSDFVERGSLLKNPFSSLSIRESLNNIKRILKIRLSNPPTGYNESGVELTEDDFSQSPGVFNRLLEVFKKTAQSAFQAQAK